MATPTNAGGILPGILRSTCERAILRCDADLDALHRRVARGEVTHLAAAVQIRALLDERAAWRRNLADLGFDPIDEGVI